MLRRILGTVVALLVLVVLVLGGELWWAHVAIRREAAPLPSLEAIEAAANTAAASGDEPIRLSVINTATQTMPRSQVLDPARDPHPNERYIMSHPSFVLEWRDARLLLVDVGMTGPGAQEFGRPIEMLGGAERIVPVVSTASALGGGAKKVQAIVFTHLHSDHVEGIAELCARVGHAVRVPMTEAQAQRSNYTTRPGVRMLAESGCTASEIVRDSALLPVAGFPGVYLIDAGGHTPGSEIILAFVQAPSGTQRYAFAGDTVNNLDGITYDVPKPFVYRTFFVPESESRQAELRAFLKRLHDEAGFTVLVSHDQRALEASGLPVWAEIREE